MSDYYNRNGQPISMSEWVRTLTPDNQRVAKTDIADNVEVSTVWLGLDHKFGASGPPIIFETMIFGGPLDQEQRRYSTEAEALAGHKQAVRKAEFANAAQFKDALAGTSAQARHTADDATGGA